MAPKDPIPFPYPKIPAHGPSTPDEPCIAFEKYDGTNLSWHWKRDEGFVAAMTRRYFITENHPYFGDGVRTFNLLYRDKLRKILTQQFPDTREAVVYSEFFGEHSFAGFHNELESKALIFFDLCLADRGLLSPAEFLTTFKDLPHPKVLFKGKITTGSFVSKLKEGQFKVMEGAVCKGGKTGQVWMCKIKTNDWLEKFKNWSKNKTSWTAPDEIERWRHEEI